MKPYTVVLFEYAANIDCLLNWSGNLREQLLVESGLNMRGPLVPGEYFECRMVKLQMAYMVVLFETDVEVLHVY